MSHSNPDTNAIIRKYEKLIFAVLNKKFPQYSGDDDLIQVGRIALWRACDKFDPDKGRFATYAYQSIYHAMLRELDKRKDEVSLNTKLNFDDGEGELQDTIEDVRLSIDNLIDMLELDEFVKTLTARQRRIVKEMRYGATRREIAKSQGVSYDTVTKEVKTIRRAWEEYKRDD